MIDISINNDMFITDNLSAAVQELDMLFNTENTELIGYTDYGTNWEQYLWDLNPSTESLTDYINTKISETYFVSGYNPHVEVGFQQGTERAIYSVKISLTDPNTGKVLDIQQYELK